MIVSPRTVAPDSTFDRVRLGAVAAAARALVDRCVVGDRRLALAVSGGCDSMVLMRAVHRVVAASNTRGLRVHVLTFDHGTGPHSAAAAALVEAEGARLGLEVVVGRAELRGADEATWRAARWRFLREASRGALIATAHTRDDQVETVVMRILRGAGARGLAALAVAADDVVRPFLGVDRGAVRTFAEVEDVAFLEDPSNASREHLRNRVRLDLLPAVRRVRPELEGELIALARRAADVRADLATAAVRFVSEEGVDGTVRVARHELATYDSAALCVLWPAIAARARVTLDRRGTLRLAQFTSSGTLGARIQLSGGVEVYRHRDSFVLRRVPTTGSVGAVALAGVVEFGDWRFRPIGPTARSARESDDGETFDATAAVDGDDPWTNALPADRVLSVRAWRASDRMRARAGDTARRVKRFFGDARVAGPVRAGWPVVLAGDEIVWIPGVRRGAAAPERSGRPIVQYACERVRGELESR